jgi:hypothetical protein
VSEAKLKETTEEARAFAIGNTSLASLFVHTPAGKTSFHIMNLFPFAFLCIFYQCLGETP